MAEFSVNVPWQLILPEGLYRKLHAHLFPGDGDEHGAVIVAGIARTNQGVRLLARDVRLAVDGKDYVPGRRGYRMLKAEFIREQISHCRDEELVYLAVHNHGGYDQVAFSSDDLASHERGYPALLDIARGMPIGALVFAQNAIAGDIWLPGGKRVALSEAKIVGRSLRKLTPAPVKRHVHVDFAYDRQARLFGDAGQDILCKSKVCIIGLGGAGSLLAEYLGRLGVGNFILVDPDRVDITNLPRLVAARQVDALAWLGRKRLPQWMRDMVGRLCRPKVDMAKRNILRANPRANVTSIFGDFVDLEVVKQILDCDYLFLAADSARARLLFNAIVHQYLIPGVQVGAKVSTDKESGNINDVFAVTRTVTSEAGCMLCNGLINASRLQQESISEKVRKAQAYVDEPGVVAPSVITLNALSTSQAANDFLFYMTGLRNQDVPVRYLRSHPITGRVFQDTPRQSPECTECGTSSSSRLARGDQCCLPMV